MVPTAVSCPCQVCFFDIPEPTDSGGGPDFSYALPIAISEEICENLMKPSVPTRASRPTITNNILRALLGARRALVVTVNTRALHEVKSTRPQLVAGLGGAILGGIFDSPRLKGP